MNILIFFQTADDTGSGRRIRIAVAQQKANASEVPSTNNETMEVDETTSFGGPISEFDFAINEKYRLIEFCVRILSLEDADGSCHQAVLLLLSRLTSEPALCSHFVVCGGLQALLQLPATPTSLSLTSVIMLILRHVLEDNTSIKVMMERLCRTLLGQPADRDRERDMMLGHFPGPGGHSQSGTKEFHYFVQLMAPLICKNMEIWQEVCENVIRLQPSPNNKPDDDEKAGVSAVYCRIAPHLQHQHNTINTTNSSSVHLNNGVQCQKGTTVSAAQSHCSLQGNQQFTLNESANSLVKMLLSLVCQNFEEEEKVESKPADANPLEEHNGKSVKHNEHSDDCSQDKEPALKEQKKLFSRNLVLRCLAELVRASPAVSLAVVHFQFQPVLTNATDTQDSSPTALSLLFDNFLTSPNLSSSATRLIAAIAACYQCPEAQSGLIQETKQALCRALSQPESPMKHKHLRALAESMQMMIQVCPSQQSTPLPSSLGGRPDKAQQMNNIIRLMYKRGLLSDLSKASHSLDLSSPELASTVNALLAPLDTLCRAVNTQHLQQQLQNQRNTATMHGGNGARNEHNARQNTGRAEENVDERVGNLGNGVAANSNNDSSQNSLSNAGQEGLANLDDATARVGEMSSDDGASSMAHILERLLHDNASGHIQDLLGVNSTTRRRNRGNFVMLEDMSDDDDENDNGDDNPGGDARDDMGNTSTINADTANDSQVREIENENNNTLNVSNGNGNNQNRSGRMEVGDVDEDFETADEDDDGDIEEEDDDDEEGVMEDDETETEDDDYGDDQESGATEAISDEAGDHVHGFIPDNIADLVLSLPAADMDVAHPPTAVQAAAAHTNSQNGPSAGTSGTTTFAHPLLSRAAVTPNVQNRSNLANVLANARSFLNGPTGFRAPQRGIGWLPRHRQNAGFVGPNIHAMFFEELNADFFRHVFGDLFGADDIENRHGANEFAINEPRTRHGVFLGGEGSARVRGDMFLQDGMLGGGWQAIGGDISNRLDAPHALMSDVPSTLQRWSEEARLLYGNHIHDMVLAADRRLYNVLCKVREKEQLEQKRQAEENAAKLAGATPGLGASTPANKQSGKETDKLQKEGDDHSRQMEATIVSPGNELSQSSSMAVVNSEVAGASPAVIEQSMDTEMATPTPVSESISPSRQMEVQNTEEVVTSSPVGHVTNPTDLTTRTNNGQTTSESNDNNENNNIPPSATVGTSADNQSNNEGSVQEVAAATSSAAASGGVPSGLEGIDPSFLEALPDNIRQEVIAEQVRLQSMRRQLQESRDVLQRLGIPQDQVAEISPEFLAALPPQIQEEIVAAQQAERARLMDEQQRDTANRSNNQPAAASNATDSAVAVTGATSRAVGQSGSSATSSAQIDNSVDPATFLATLPANLRQQVLSDMDDSLVNILPQDLASEARRLRQEAEERQARVLQQRMNDIGGGLDFVYGLRPPGGGRGRFATFRTSLPIGRGGRPLGVQLHRDAAAEARAAAAESAVKQLLDHEGLACLVILLFVTESRSYYAKLKSLLLCLCQHKPTRIWIIDTLISILRRAAESTSDSNWKPNDGNGWLNIGMESALGGRTRVFQIPHSSGKKLSSQQGIAIHHLAASIVCRQTLDILQAIAKNFPSQFVQQMTFPVFGDTHPIGNSHQESDFWDILAKLDNAQSSLIQVPTTPSRKSRLRASGSESSQTSIAGAVAHTSQGVTNTPLAALMALLGCVNVKKSQQLTDKILSLMHMITQLPNLSALVGELQKNLSLKEDASQISNSPLKVTSNKGGVIVEEGTTSSIDTQNDKEQQAIIGKLLPLVIDAMIGKTCSEDGLEDATSLLANLSHVNQPTCDLVKRLLIQAARDVGKVVCLNVRNLLQDIDHVCPPLPKVQEESQEIAATTSYGFQAPPGRLTDRYTGSEIVVSGPKKVHVLSADLQLPSVALFTSRTASQRYLLRILKAIRQLQKPSKQSSGTSEVSLDSSKIQEALTLSEQLNLDDLWTTLSDCLTRLEHSADPQAVLLLQSAVEAFFIVHSKPPEAGAKSQQPRQSTSGQLHHIVPPEPATSPLTSTTPLPSHQQRFVHFAEKHRVVLNQILRQSTQPLNDGPFAVLANYTRILDFDVKRRYFRQELERTDGTDRRRDDLAVHVRRQQVFEDSYRELHRRTPEEWKARFFVIFDGEEGQDAGGLLREWFVILSREIFNPHYALFRTSPGDRVTYAINELSSFHADHLLYFKFVGQLIAKAIYENKLLDCYFTRSFYKHILGIPVKYTDMESEDYTLYKNLVYLLEHNASDLGIDLTFSTEIPVFGEMRIRDLKQDGRNLPVTEENKREYVQLLCQMKMTGIFSFV